MFQPSALQRRLAVAIVLIVSTAAAASDYDPLALPDEETSAAHLVANDEARKRPLPLYVYLPPKSEPAPVVLFSHGLGGTRYGSAFLGKHWAARGYVAVFLQHPGSDDSVWRDKPLGQRLAAMRDAASSQNFLSRAADVHAVLNALEQWNKRTDNHQLAARLDLDHVGMSGHSFGAVTTQAVSGQTFLRGALSATDPRIKAAVAFSPSSPRQGTAADAFGSVKIPWMLMTGTNDRALVGDQTPQTRLEVFPALPPGDKYELLLDGAEHSAFTDRALPGDRAQRNPNHHRVLLALTTAFWDAYLKEDAAAKAWLQGDGPSTVLEKTDRWQKK